MKNLFPVLILFILIVACRQKVKENSDLKNIDTFKSIVFDRLSKDEYQLSPDQLCYIKPMLDTLNSWDKVEYKDKGYYKIVNAHLAYCDLNLSLIEVKNRKFLFTSQIDRDLMIYSNNNFQKEVIPTVGNITGHTDFKEFNNMISYFKENEIYDNLQKNEIVDIFTECFMYNLPWYNSNKQKDKYKPISNPEDLESWKDIHLGKFKNQIDLSFSKEKIYIPYFKYGLIILSFEDEVKIELLKKVYPNDTKFTNSYDVGIPTCDELKMKVSQR